MIYFHFMVADGPLASVPLCLIEKSLSGISLNSLPLRLNQLRMIVTSRNGDLEGEER